MGLQLIVLRTMNHRDRCPGSNCHVVKRCKHNIEKGSNRSQYLFRISLFMTVPSIGFLSVLPAQCQAHQYLLTVDLQRLIYLQVLTEGTYSFSRSVR